MSSPRHAGIVFEDEVCETFKANGWLFDGPLPYRPGHANNAGYDKRVALYPEDAIAWVKETQPDTWDKFAKKHTKDPEAVFIQRLAEELDRDRPTIKRETPQLWGSLLGLRKGCKDINATFRMAQFAPSNRQNATTSSRETLISQIGPGSTIATSARVERPPKLRYGRLSTQSRLIADLSSSASHRPHSLTADAGLAFRFSRLQSD